MLQIVFSKAVLHPNDDGDQRLHVDIHPSAELGLLLSSSKHKKTTLERLSQDFGTVLTLKNPLGS